MSDATNGISRRSVLKGAAIGGLGLAAGDHCLLVAVARKLLETSTLQFVEI